MYGQRNYYGLAAFIVQANYSGSFKNASHICIHGEAAAQIINQAKNHDLGFPLFR